MKNLKINLKFKSFHHKNFNEPLIKILEKFNGVGIKTSNIIYLPSKLERYTVLRSPHIDKKSREQFEKILYNRLIVIYINLKDLNILKKLKFLLIFLKNSCGGIQVKVTYSS